MNQVESFARTGTAYIKNVLTEQQRTRFVDLMFEMKNDGRAKFEGGNTAFYGSSFGSNHPEFEEALRGLHSRMEQEIGLKGTIANSYGRIYFNGGTLKPHVDRKGLDYTLSITLQHKLDFPWPLWVIDNEGQTREFNIREGDGAIIRGTAQSHWRNHLWCREDQHSVQLFMHWTDLS